MVIFDYVFFRLARWFIRYDGKDGTSAISVLSVVQIVWALVLFFEIKRLLTGTTQIPGGKGYGGVVGLVLVVASFAFNHRRYGKAYDTLATTWQDESSAQAVCRGVLVLLLVGSPFAALAYFLG